MITHIISFLPVVTKKKEKCLVLDRKDYRNKNQNAPANVSIALNN